MKRTVTILLAGSIAALFVLGNFTHHESANAQKGKQIKGRLPTYWTKLGLSKDQRIQVYQIQSEFQTKIKALEDQIAALKKEEKSKMLGVLTKAQTNRLRNIYLQKAGLPPLPDETANPGKD